MEERRARNREEKRDRKLREKTGIDDDKVPVSDKIEDWLSSQADRRRSSNSSIDLESVRRSSIISATSGLSAQSMPIGELEDKEARKRRLANWAEDERRKSLGDLEKSKKMKLIKQQLLAKKMKLLKQIKEQSSSSSSESSSDTDSD